MIALALILLLPMQGYGDRIMYQPEKPRMLIGYRTVLNFQPQLTVNFNKKSEDDFSVELLMKANGAKHMLISNFSDFRKARWQKYQPSVLWRLDKKMITTVYVVFKKKDIESGTTVISPILHYTLDRSNKARVLEYVKHGYIDWTSGALLVHSKEHVLLANGSLQRDEYHRQMQVYQERVQNRLYSSTIEMLLDMRITPTYRLRQKMVLENLNSIEELNLFGRNVRLIENSVKPLVNYGENLNFEGQHQANYEIEAVGYFSLTVDQVANTRKYRTLNSYFNGVETGINSQQAMDTPDANFASFLMKESNGMGNTLNDKAYGFKTFYKYIKPPSRKLKILRYYEEDFHTLVLDMRGYNYTPSMFPIIENEMGEEVFNSSVYSTDDVPFVRYIRSLEGLDLPAKTLFVKAYDLRKKNQRVIVSQRHWKSLLSSATGVQSVSNGNFWVLVD